jgi:hypothetical protein
MCVIALSPNPSGDFGNYEMFLLGDTFLRNFYSVYDFETKSVWLAANLHAKDIVRISDRKDQRQTYLIVMSIAALLSLVIFIAVSIKHNKKQVRHEASKFLSTEN